MFRIVTLKNASYGRMRLLSEKESVEFRREPHGRESEESERPSGVAIMK